MLQIGKVYLYKNKPCLITGGNYEIKRRVSNFWYGQLIKKDGTLGKSICDYDNGPFSEYKEKYKIITKVLLNL